MNILLQAQGRGGGIALQEILIILIIGVVIFVYFYLVYMLCKEAENRKGANKTIVALLSIFITPICGILYLLLFPRNNS